MEHVDEPQQSVNVADSTQEPFQEESTSKECDVVPDQQSSSTDQPYDDGEISEEEMDHIADIAISSLEGILKYFNLGEITIDEYEGDEDELILDITGDNLAVLIGRHGKTLDALQFIISSITSHTLGYRYPIIVDVEGYKNRQRQKLESLAYAMADKAIDQGRPIKMRPMSPYDRRIVHVALRDYDGVTTCSEGEGNGRRVVVSPE